jgi:hypothetical protein
MTQYDAAATPMLNSFSDTRNLTPYSALKPAPNILAEKNGPNAPMAALAGTLDFSLQDLAPEQLLNQMIWQSVRGADSQMPAPRTSFRATEIPGSDG